MKQSIERYSERTLKHEADRVTGYALACLGTVRSAWWSKTKNDWTYDEWSATIFNNKEDAIEEMLADNKREIWKYLMLVPVMENKPYLLPTVMGQSIVA